jgi:hypothetical protein
LHTVIKNERVLVPTSGGYLQRPKHSSQFGVYSERKVLGWFAIDDRLHASFRRRELSLPILGADLGRR